ncbi:hypothetical protein F3Y22_tig00110819pilonHSYRG00313 [Hibiscus syriacus]|uniref:Plastocyanin-like domain-containing protein n=1 Tax=Hibiscus syriacus TaxID=106335 RepID=A0A6A2ZMY3_HIBSY|nr:hypothetical protein F3Y22_tig00110819pilonHSYRG00313 [Hibiscus syriacus]
MRTSTVLSSSIFVTFFVLVGCFMAYPKVVTATQAGIIRDYTFNVFNGKFHGPRVVAREGDLLVVKVVNHVPYNISIHWHGIRQPRSERADGPAYITQCPIQTGQSNMHNFTITGQRDTLFWHAHFSWLRATVYGPLIILPRRNESYHFVKPYKQV